MLLSAHVEILSVSYMYAEFFFLDLCNYMGVTREGVKKGKVISVAHPSSEMGSEQIPSEFSRGISYN